MQRSLGSLGPRARVMSSQAAHAAVPAYNHCVELIARHDRERYLCDLHAPAVARPGLFALTALNYETARVRNAASSEAAARARFTWWRDAVATASSESSIQPHHHEHPVVAALAHASRHHGLTTRYIMQLLDARENDVLVQQPRSMKDLRQYAERTAGSILLLGLECAGITGDDTAELAAVQVGTALGIATLLRGTAAHARQGCTYLPADVTSRHGVKLSAMLRGEDSGALRDAVAEIADEGVKHLLAARSMQDALSPTARLVLLPATLADHILSNLQGQGYSPFAESLLAPMTGPSMQVALMWRRMSGRF